MTKLTPVCACWFCLRESGVTPRAEDASRHPDVLGVVYRTDDGQPVSQPAKGRAA